MSASAKYRCKECHKNIAATGQSPSPLRYRKHDREKGAECENSRTIVPPWIVKRGPEAEDSDVPVIGRDYAPCPDCKRAPLLDDEGRYAKHIKDAGVPSAERVDCPKSGQPYTPEGEECTTAPETPTDGGSAGTRSEVSAPTEAEQLLSKWATTVREIEDRKLPESSPVSTPTPQALPPRPDAPEAPPIPAPAREAVSTAAPASKKADAAEPAAPASADASPKRRPNGHGGKSESESGQSPTAPPDISALASLFPRSVRTPDGTATSAGPAPAAAPAVDAPTQAAEPSTAATLPTPVDALPSSSPFAQPGSPFSQPAKVPAAVTDPIPMTVLAEQVAARMKELFYSYDSRNTSDNRSAQTTLGPSEIGSPCDRRIAMSLMRIPAVNPGGDGWAAFKGTAIHAALAELFTWASGNTGRFAVEVPLHFPSEHVPRGTTDLLDRVLVMVDDHKIQSRWSQDQLKVNGMTATQRVQLHTYGFGARLQGEVVDHVALISWPMESSSLDDLYAVIEPYDPQIARDALERVDGIAAEIKMHEAVRATWAGLDINAQKLSIARQFPVADDCKFCEWYAPGDADGTRGCNGRA